MSNNIESETWLKSEFEQNIGLIKDYDGKIIDIIKFYFTLLLGIMSVVVAIIKFSGFNDYIYLLGIISLTFSFAGHLLLLWIYKLRSYFVLAARQINAVRKYYREILPDELKEIIIQPTNVKYPGYYHKSSSHIIAMYLIIFFNAFAICVSSYIFISPCKICTSTIIILSIIIGIIDAAIFNYILYKKLKEKENE